MVAGLLLCIGVHSQVPQLVHGDIKNTNVVVEATWNGGLNIKLLDFGLGRVPTRTSKTLRQHIGVASP